MPINKKDLNELEIRLSEEIRSAIAENNKMLVAMIKEALVVSDARLAILFDEKVREHQLVTKDDISHLPTKHDFYNKMDEVLGEVKDERQENVVQQAKLEDHEDRLTNVETKLSISY